MASASTSPTQCAEFLARRSSLDVIEDAGLLDHPHRGGDVGNIAVLVGCTSCGATDLQVAWCSHRIPPFDALTVRFMGIWTPGLNPAPGSVTFLEPALALPVCRQARSTGRGTLGVFPGADTIKDGAERSSRATPAASAHSGFLRPFWNSDPHRVVVHSQYMNGTTPFEITKNYKFTELNRENVWAKALNRVVNEKMPADKAVDEMIAASRWWPHNRPLPGAWRRSDSSVRGQESEAAARRAAEGANISRRSDSESDEMVGSRSQAPLLAHDY